MKISNKSVLIICMAYLLTGCGSGNQVPVESSSGSQVQEQVSDNPQNNEPMSDEAETVYIDDFIPDYTEGQKNHNGNIFCNIKNGGWVTEQGDWNYYAYDSCISKENVVTGEMYILCNYPSSDDGPASINVCGDYIYWKYGRTFFRIRTDGTDYTEYPVEGAKLRTWAVYENVTYVILDENASAETYNAKVKKLDWDSGEMTEICNLGELGDEDEDEEGRFLIGMEDGYVYLCEIQETEETKGLGMFETHQYKRDYIQISLEKSSSIDLYVESEYHQMDEYGYMINCVIKNQCIYVVGRNKEVIDCKSGTLEPLITSEGELELFFGGQSWNMPNFVDDMMVVTAYNGTDNRLYGISGEKIHEITSDSPSAVLIAHGKIYYIHYDGSHMYCRINPDGSGWEQL